MFGTTGEMRIENLEDNALNLTLSACDIGSHAVQIFVRPLFGTLYYPVPVTALSCALMLVIPGILALFTNFMSMIPLLHAQPVTGMFSLFDFSKLFFIASSVHGVRLWRRRLDMSLEDISDYEGPALPFFDLLPKGRNFFVTRIIWEPLFVLLLSIVLKDLFIIQAPLALYLKLAALCMLVKGYVVWLQAWKEMRMKLDARNAAPRIARFIEGTATGRDLDPLHLATLPTNLDPEIRQATLAQIAREYSPDNAKH